jgi:hypothetical protein
MGLCILIFVFAAALQSLLPRSWRQCIAHGMQSHGLAFNRLYLLFTSVFVVFGALRAIHHLLAGSSALPL